MVGATLVLKLGHFIDMSKDDPLSWMWDFGDRSNSTKQKSSRGFAIKETARELHVTGPLSPGEPVECVKPNRIGAEVLIGGWLIKKNLRGEKSEINR